MLIVFSRSQSLASWAVRAATTEGGYGIDNGWSHCAAVLPGSRVIDSMWGYGVRAPRSLAGYTRSFTEHAYATVYGINDNWAEHSLLDQIGKGYDYSALPAFVLPRWFGARDWQDDGAWICSELIAYALASAGMALPEEASSISPNRLALMLGLRPSGYPSIAMAAA